MTRSEAGRKGGLVTAAKNNLTGENQRRGRIAGRRAVESGFIAVVASLGGKARSHAPDNIERLKYLQANVVDLPMAAKKANHIRWHEERGLYNAKCLFCRPDGPK